jgi:hypothetical protein
MRTKALFDNIHAQGAKRRIDRHTIESLPSSWPQVSVTNGFMLTKCGERIKPLHVLKQMIHPAFCGHITSTSSDKSKKLGSTAGLQQDRSANVSNLCKPKHTL